MKILKACEESQTVCKEFRNLGHEAYSCDILDCSGGHPEWHIKGDVVPLLKQKWDMIVAFPPCTYLTNTGNRWFDIKKYGLKALERHELRKKAIDFFMLFTKTDCNKVAIENPIGIISTVYQKPNQIIHPYMFGDAERKSTCLWLKGLPKLKPTDIKTEYKPYLPSNTGGAKRGQKATPKSITQKESSKTFRGVAKAMAEQWSVVLTACT